MMIFMLAMLVRHRIGLQEVVGAVRRIKKDKKSIKVDDGDDSYYEQYRRVYESLLYLLQTEPYPLVGVADLVSYVLYRW